MRLYIAGASADHERVKALAAVAHALGYEITHEWWDVVAAARIAGMSDRDLDHERRRNEATKDLCAVQLSQIFWLVCPDPGTVTTGAWAELGAAVVSGCTVIASGDHKQSLFTAKATRLFDTHKEALMFLEQLKAAA